MRLSICLLAVFALVPPISVMSQDQNQVVNELTKQVNTLQAENDKLRAQLLEFIQRDNLQRSTATAEAEKLRTQVELQMMHADYQAVLQDHLQQIQREYKINEVAQDEQLDRLRMELDKLSHEEAVLAERGSATSASAMGSVAQRMAQAQLENRIRLLESRALLDVLQDRREHANDKITETAQLAEEKAAVLIEQRLVQMEGIKQQIELAKDERNRLELINALRMAESELEEARLIAKEVQSEFREGNSELDHRIAEAALEIAVSERVDSAFEAEMRRIQELLAKGGDIDRIKDQKAAIESEILALKMEASKREHAMRKQQLEIEQQLSERLKEAQDKSQQSKQ